MRVLLIVVLAGVALVAAELRADDFRPSPDQRLAALFAATATRFMESEVLTVDAIEAAVMLLEEAAALDGEDPELWRLLLDTALLAERDDVVDRALRQVVRLDPQDDVIRLRRLNAAIEQYQSVEERDRAYARLLRPEVRAELGAPVASRLAFDWALLQRRRGDLDAFADTLADAVALDPSNRAAAAIAAGVFRMNVDDPFAEAELLVNMMLADPTDVTGQIALGELLLEHGAYEGAARLYGLAVRNQITLRHRPADNLLADQATALWGAGNPDAALRVIRNRQAEADEIRNRELREAQPDLDPVERGAERGSISPTLATVRAAILRERGAPTAGVAVTQALDAYDRAIERMMKSDSDVTELIERYRFEKAWVAACLADDPAVVAELRDEAERDRPISEGGRLRFDGWVALRTGDPVEAIRILESVDDPDQASWIGRAEASLAVGRQRDAARALLEAIRLRPGSLLGVWAVDQLASLLGRRAPVSTVARRMEALIDSIPMSFDQATAPGGGAIAIRIEPVKSTYAAFEPLLFDIEIGNESIYPLAVDRDGPLRPQVLLKFSATVQRNPRGPRLQPVVVDLGRRLRLDPRERIRVRVDLSRFAVGDVLRKSVVSGLFLRVKAMVNFMAAPTGSLEPALLGTEQWTETVRIEGARATGEWLIAQMNELQSAESPAAADVALLGHVALPPLPPELPAELFELQARARAAFVAAVQRMEPSAQAWVVGVLPPGMLPKDLARLAATGENRLLLLTYLLSSVEPSEEGLEDPVLQLALASDDEHVRMLGRAAEETIQRAVDARRAPSR